jgi:hypothetical protein
MSDPVQTFLGLIEGGRFVKVCEGTEPERTQAVRAVLENESRGCIVDAITFHVIRRLNIESAVEAVCGPIGVTDVTVQQLLFDVSGRLDEPDLSISWQDGQYFRTETSPEQKRAARDVLEEDLRWIAERDAVLPAAGLHDPPPELRRLARLVSTGFADEYLAAQSSGRILVSEDLAYRVIGQELFDLKSTWLQPILMTALQCGHLDRPAYNGAVLAMIRSRETFISVDADALIYELDGVSELPGPENFVTAVSVLGGTKADIPSHLRVVAETAIKIWGSDWDVLLKKAAMGKLLEAVIRERGAQAGEIVRSLIYLIASKVQVPERAVFRKYVLDWAQGHFVQIT